MPEEIVIYVMAHGSTIAGNDRDKASKIGFFILAGHARDGGPDNLSSKPLTCENTREADGLRSRVRRFESCRGHSGKDS